MAGIRGRKSRRLRNHRLTKKQAQKKQKTLKIAPISKKTSINSLNLNKKTFNIENEQILTLITRPSIVKGVKDVKDVKDFNDISNIQNIEYENDTPTKYLNILNSDTPSIKSLKPRKFSKNEILFLLNLMEKYGENNFDVNLF